MFAAVLGPAWAQPLFRVTDLTEVVAPYGELRAINDRGQMAGVRVSPIDQEWHLIRYSDSGGLEDLGPFESAAMGPYLPIGKVPPRVRAINNQGWIAGSATLNAGEVRGFLYRDGIGTEDIGLLGDSETGVKDMNNHGAVVGIKYLPWSPEYEVGFQYTSEDGIKLVGELSPGGESQALGINDDGVVVGRAWKTEPLHDDDYTRLSRAFRFTPGLGMEDLGSLTADGVSEAHDINNPGVIVGVAAVPGHGNAPQAVIWIDSQIDSIGSFGGKNIFGLRINDLNHVVGRADTADGRVIPFFWSEETGMKELNDLIDPDTGYAVSAIFDLNNADQMVGVASLNGEVRWVRLDLIPEPSTWALLALGLGALLMHQRRCAGRSV